MENPDGRIELMERDRIGFLSSAARKMNGKVFRLLALPLRVPQKRAEDWIKGEGGEEGSGFPVIAGLLKGIWVSLDDMDD